MCYVKPLEGPRICEALDYSCMFGNQQILFKLTPQLNKTVAVDSRCKSLTVYLQWLFILDVNL